MVVMMGAGWTEHKVVRRVQETRSQTKAAEYRAVSGGLTIFGIWERQATDIRFSSSLGSLLDKT